MDKRQLTTGTSAQARGHAATAACVEACTILHHLFTRLRRNRASSSRSSAHRTDHFKHKRPSLKRHKAHDKPSMPPPATKSEATTRPDMSAADHHHSISSASTSRSRRRPPREQSNCFLCNDEH
ncbi:hypothetical protein RB195_002754 [Necator americanus]|uniref:Uncharacterized protein n=1 Tax=Necator americanus TaxID=51031 RepID=A0ABR1DKY5_NECAM